MDDTILDDWFTKSQAAAVLQVSEKTIERLATKGEIRRSMTGSARSKPGSPTCGPIWGHLTKRKKSYAKAD